MRTSAARWTAGSVAVASVALIAAGLALAFADRHHVPATLTSWDFSDIAGDLEDLTIPALAYLVASRRPRNPIGWLALTAGLVLAASTFGTSYALHALYAAPGSLPGARAALWVNNSLAVVPIGTVVFLFLLFPSGRLRSRRWLPVAWFEAVSLGFLLVVSIAEATRYYSRPFAFFGGAQAPALLQLGQLLIPVAILLSVISLIVRFVKSAGDERLQLKWFATAAVLVLLTIIPSALTNSAAASVVLNVALFCMNGAVALAILKYRLYDIDIVISKALQYGALAAFITAVYAALVVGVGAAVGDQHSVYLSAVAAAVVAVAFQPVRQRAALVANRLVYGRRATPYQVLSEFAHRIGGTYADDDVLPQMARMVAAGTGARRVVVWLRVGGELRPGATAGDPGAVPGPGAVRRCGAARAARAAGLRHQRADPLPGGAARRARDPDATGRAAAPGGRAAGGGRGRAGRAGAVQRGADLRAAGIPPAAGDGRGRGAAAAGAQPARRGAAGPGGDGHQAEARGRRAW
jgi:hypothetical protein